MLSMQGDLKIGCLEVLNLAARLRVSGDMMAVYCVAALGHLQDGKVTSSCELHPLQAPDIRSLARRLKQIPKQHLTSPPDLRGALLHAIKDLSALDGLAGPTIPDIARDIIVISSNPADVVVPSLGIDPSFRIHLFNPGTIPYTAISYEDYFLTGSVLFSESTSGNEETYDLPSQIIEPRTSTGWVLDSAKCISGHCHKHRSHSLEDVLAYCRTQPQSGSISNISISFQARPDAVIENILGDLDYPILSPGQVISLMVQVRLRALRPPFLRSHSPTSFGQSLPLSVSEAISDLEMTLGEQLSELFDVQVRYNHSLFPENTQLLANETCWLPRTLSPRRKHLDQDDLVHEHVQVRSSVQKQLALCLANLKNPEEAMESLEAMSCSNRATASCLKLIEKLREALRHRIGILASDTGSEGHTSLGHRSPPLSPMLPLSLPSRGLSPLEVETQHRIHELEKLRRPSYESPVTVVRRKLAPTPDIEASNETARKIWQHIRKTSKPEGEFSQERLEARKKEEPTVRHIEEIKKTVLRNQRKMSAETLRSLARDIRHVSRGLGHFDEVDD
jgi:hypothetical protein